MDHFGEILQLVDCSDSPAIELTKKHASETELEVAEQGGVSEE